MDEIDNQTNDTKARNEMKKLANYILLKSLHTDAVLVKKGGQSGLDLNLLAKIGEDEKGDVDLVQPKGDLYSEADKAILGRKRKNAIQTKKKMRRP
jgi:hypothetical protein